MYLTTTEIHVYNVAIVIDGKFIARRMTRSESNAKRFYKTFLYMDRMRVLPEDCWPEW